MSYHKFTGSHDGQGDDAWDCGGLLRHETWTGGGFLPHQIRSIFIFVGCWPGLLVLGIAAIASQKLS